MRGAAVGTINKYKEIKMPDGTWKYIGSKGKDHPVVKELMEKGLVTLKQETKPVSHSSDGIGVKTIWTDTTKYPDLKKFPKGTKVIGIVSGKSVRGVVEKYAGSRVGVRVLNGPRIPVSIDNISKII